MPRKRNDSVMLSEVLDRVRKAAEDNGWCTEAEAVVCDAFELGNTVNVFQPPSVERPMYCCESCNGMTRAQHNAAVATATVPRFTLAIPDRRVPLVDLKAAIKRANRLAGAGEYRALYLDLINKYQLALDLPFNNDDYDG